MDEEREQAPQRPGPIGGDMAAVLSGLARRVRLDALQERHDSTLVLGLFAFVNGLVSIAIMAAAASTTGAPLIFPSLGPDRVPAVLPPTSPAASPRNTVLGHLVGVAAGFIALVVFGLTQAEPALTPRSPGLGSVPPHCRWR